MTSATETHVDRLERVPNAEERACRFLEPGNGREAEGARADLEQLVRGLFRSVEHVHDRLGDEL